ncbi:MAG: hypothetical protein JJU29_02030 [Verrucomicrobia bacterium]|nr:hypothetical protein [Verrucomicrobiota bacterium]
MTTKHKATGESINAAMKVLEEAAKDKRDEMQDIFSDKYGHLKTLFMENEKSLMKTLHKAKDNAVDVVTDFEKESVRRAREMGQDVDKSVHKFPWYYIGSSLFAGLTLGVALHRKFAD